MAILTAPDGTEYDDTVSTLDSQGQVVPLGTTGDTTNYGNEGTAATTPPAGAVNQVNGNWVNAVGQILGPVAASAITPALNNLASGGLLGQGTSMLQAGGNAFNGVSSPSLTSLIPQLQLQVMQGQMTPAQAAAAVQQASAMNNVQTDQGSLAGQRAALASLANIGTNGGMTQADQAQLASTMAATNANAASQRQAQIQQMQMQGNGGTGAELAARLEGAQGAANSNAAAGATVAQAAQARALAALQANLQGNANLNTQQFNQQAQIAQAQNAVNEFNAQAQQSTNLANAQNQQAANTNNFNTANQIAGTNTGIMNTQAMLPLNTANQQFQNQLGLATAQGKNSTAAGTAAVNAATGQITRSTTAAGTAPPTGTGTTGTAGTTGSTGSTGTGSSSNPLTNAISGGVSSAIGNAISGGLSDLGNAVSSTFGFKDGGYVKPASTSDMSDADIDDMMAKLTAYKYRRK